jgi:transcriptional regulator with XRE-family HTH domain
LSVNSKIGELIKATRQKRKLTIKQLSDKVCLTEKQIREIEKGVYDPKWSEIMDVFSVLNVFIDINVTLC